MDKSYKVKKVEVVCVEQNEFWEADTPVGSYEMVFHDIESLYFVQVHLPIERFFIGRYETFHEATAAIQSDFESRITQGLEVVSE